MCSDVHLHQSKCLNRTFITISLACALSYKTILINNMQRPRIKLKAWSHCYCGQIILFVFWTYSACCCFVTDWCPAADSWAFTCCWWRSIEMPQPGKYIGDKRGLILIWRKKMWLMMGNNEKWKKLCGVFFCVSVSISPPFLFFFQHLCFLSKLKTWRVCHIRRQPMNHFRDFMTLMTEIFFLMNKSS